nr:MAG TPA: hypothetical protein [Crassvirales sp.]
MHLCECFIERVISHNQQPIMLIFMLMLELKLIISNIRIRTLLCY